MKIMIGLDVGTSGSRAVAYDAETGREIGRSEVESTMITPRPAWAEQDALVMLDGVVTTLKTLAAHPLVSQGEKVGICISTAMHSIMPLDRAMRPLSPMMVWADCRATEEAAWLDDAMGAGGVYSRTACPSHPMYPVAKILWLRRNRTETTSQTAFYASLKDYLFYQLTGEFKLDRSMASASGLLNYESEAWDNELIAALGIKTSMLPEVVATTHYAPLTKAMARATGLAEGLPIVIGAGDGCLANLGIGAVGPDKMALTIGTSGAVRKVVKKPPLDAKARSWCYNLAGDAWVMGGAINNGGIVLRWIRDHFAMALPSVSLAEGRDPYELICELASTVEAGADGLVLLPFFSGERSPHWDASARGVFLGMHFRHQPAHFIRAALEGVAYSMKDTMLALEETAGPASELLTSGSFTRSPLWVSILADVLDRPITMPRKPEGSSFGAALLGLVALGLLPSLEATLALSLGETTEITPDPARSRAYAELFAVYRDAYHALRPQFRRLSNLQENNPRP